MKNMNKKMKKMMTAAVAVAMAAAIGTPAFAEVNPVPTAEGTNPLVMPVAVQMAPGLVVDGVALTDAPEAYLDENGVWMVPLRVVSEALGFTVTYRPDLGGVDIQKDNQFTSLFFGRNEYFFNRVAPFELESAPVLKPGITFVPLSFFDRILKQTVVSAPGELIIGKDTRPIALGVDMNEEFTITLAENPSAGYSWTYVISGADGMEVVKDEFIAPENEDMVGAPGVREWVFRPDAAGEFVITFTYARPFDDEETEPADVVVYNILVEDVAGGQEHMPEEAE